jgi:predicted GNAT superfamily acetyltransferase
VKRRLSRHPRKRLDLAHYLSAETPRLNETQINGAGLITPCPMDASKTAESLDASIPFLLLEIPADFLALKTADSALAHEWRFHTRSLFEKLFAIGYLVTDFIHLEGSQPRSFYVLSHGESTL